MIHIPWYTYKKDPMYNTDGFLLIHYVTHELLVDKSNTRATTTSNKQIRKQHTLKIFSPFSFRKLHEHFLKVCRLVKRVPSSNDPTELTFSTL